MKSVRKLLWLMTPDQRRGAGTLLVLLLIGMLLETLSIGLIVPVLALMTQRDLAHRYPALAPWLHRLGDPSLSHLIVGGMLLLVGATAIKVLFVAVVGWWQAKFVFSLRTSLSQRLFEGYLRQPYTFHLQKNSAELLHNVNLQVAEVARVTQQGLILIAEVFVLAGIFALLLFIEPIGAVTVVGILGLAGWGFTRITRRRTRVWSETRLIHEKLRIQHLQQGLGGVKDLKLLGRENGFLALYQLHDSGSAKFGVLQDTMLALPRLWLELLMATGLGALVTTMLWRHRPLDVLLPSLGIFAAAAFRVMPSVNRIVVAVQAARFSIPSIDCVYREFLLLAATPVPAIGRRLQFADTLAIDQVSFYYADTESPALSNINLSIRQRSSVGFIGGSGAGKTTLVDILLGLLAPSCGAVRIDGVDIQTNLRGWQDQIGYVPQSVYLTDDTLRRNIAFGLPDSEIDDTAVWRALRSAQLEVFVNNLALGLETMVGERGVRISGGERQRIGIARALYHDPPVLVLDEATSSLDTQTESGVMDAVRMLQGTKTVLVVAHRLSTIAGCERVIRLEKGCVVEDGDGVVVLANAMKLSDSATRPIASGL